MYWVPLYTGLTGIRDLIATEGIVVEHVRGVRIIADPLTKALGIVNLMEAYEKLQMSMRQN